MIDYEYTFLYSAKENTSFDDEYLKELFQRSPVLKRSIFGNLSFNSIQMEQILTFFFANDFDTHSFEMHSCKIKIYLICTQIF